MLLRLSKTVLIFIVLEICLGGGGHLTAFGPLSLRMVLFAFAVILSIILLMKGKSISWKYWKLELLFLLMISTGVLVALINQNPMPAIWEDVKPLLYFLVLPFFALTIEKAEVSKVSSIFKAGPVVMAVAFALVLLLLITKIIPFNDFYGATEKTQEFFYRGKLSFFCKGFIFFGVGAIFFFFSDSKLKYWFILFLILAIVASVTRGFLFSLALTFAIYYFRSKPVYSLSLVAVACAIVLWGNSITMTISEWIDSPEKKESAPSKLLFGDRNYSDAGRLGQLQEVKEQITFSSVLAGHGFGHGVPSRPVHMEISYLEIFHKQGIVGLIFWSILFLNLIRSYNQTWGSSLANAFLFSSLFIFVQSLTNMYINNPIGIAVLLLSIVCLDIQRKEG